MRPDAEQEMSRVLDTLQIPRSVARTRPPQNAPNYLQNTHNHQNINDNRESNSLYMPSSHQYPVTTAPLPQLGIHRTHDYVPSVFDYGLPTAASLEDLYVDNFQSSSHNSYPDQRNSMAWTSQPSALQQQNNNDDDDHDDSASETGDEAETEVIEQLSSRIGTLKLAGDGHLRFYGPTSNLNLVDVASTSKQIPGPDVRSVRHDGQELLNHLRIGQHVEPNLENHLIELYFTWQNPSLYVVDREMFTQAQTKWRTESDDTPFYSEVLTNAM